VKRTGTTETRARLAPATGARKRGGTLFVYGTLLSGERNASRLSASILIDRVRTAPGFELYDLGAFPAMVRSEAGQVQGELYRAPADVVEALDVLEGHPRFYRRTRVRLEDGTMAESYLLRRQAVRGYAQVASGCWRHRLSSDCNGCVGSASASEVRLP
jgi:gamma-glutamylcyclotransferase (GGCT)/AIG2-like uncharacterized protein YtfP